MSADTDSIVPALTESIAIVRERDRYREALRDLQRVLLADTPYGGLNENSRQTAMRIVRVALTEKHP